MSSGQADHLTPEPRLRLWPGLLLAGLVVSLRFGVPLVAPGFEGFRIAVVAGLFGALGIFIWWTFFSRARASERWAALTLVILALVLTWRLNHESMRLMWAVYYALPLLALGLVAWSVAGRALADWPRRAALLATVFSIVAPWTLVRMDGFTGDHVFELSWRWAETTEASLTPIRDDSGAQAKPVGAVSASPASWPGFRGAGRNGAVSGAKIETDWVETPPFELWRRPVGPGWSSFAVDGERVYTQEQRGEEEIVTCYDRVTGEPRWRHVDRVRFYEAMGGPGPRATPALGDGHLYALGATGILNALDARSGRLSWSRDVAADTGSDIPIWGFSSSPLLFDDLVIVAADGRLAAYDRATGEPRWLGPDGGPSYSSPHLLTIDGVPQVVLLHQTGATSVTPGDGTLLWEHEWGGVSLVQPALTTDGGLLISAGEGKGLRRLDVRRTTAEWRVEERWTSNRLKPNFNDFVVHDGHAYGFDGSLLACLDVESGERCWKGGRYGHGQLVLLSDQDLLLVVSERGELALVAAQPDAFVEVARFSALTGKTWNHPVVVRDLLLVRNSEEMAAFRLSPTTG